MGKPLPEPCAIRAVEQRPETPVTTRRRSRDSASRGHRWEGEPYEDRRRSRGDTGDGRASVSPSEVRRRRRCHPLRAIGIDGAGAVPGEGETTRPTPIRIVVWPDAGRLARCLVPRGRAEWSVENRFGRRGERPEHAGCGREEPRPEEKRRGQEGRIQPVCGRQAAQLALLLAR